MLGKTADGLFWMFRYLERNENTARLLDAGFRIALTRAAAAENEWASVITTIGVKQPFMEKIRTDGYGPRHRFPVTRPIQSFQRHVDDSVRTRQCPAPAHRADA